MEGIEMEIKKPETQLEREALEKAKEEEIKKRVEDKQKTYQDAMKEYLIAEESARDFRKKADKLAEQLGITEKEKKAIF